MRTTTPTTAASGMIQQKTVAARATLTVTQQKMKGPNSQAIPVPILSTQIDRYMYSVQHPRYPRAQWPAWIWKKLWYVTFAVISVEYISEHHMLL